MVRKIKSLRALLQITKALASQHIGRIHTDLVPVTLLGLVVVYCQEFQLFIDFKDLTMCSRVSCTGGRCLMHTIVCIHTYTIRFWGLRKGASLKDLGKQQCLQLDSQAKLVCFVFSPHRLLHSSGRHLVTSPCNAVDFKQVETGRSEEQSAGGHRMEMRLWGEAVGESRQGIFHLIIAAYEYNQLSYPGTSSRC